ncbi:MAG TPA: substrate binding domain-containing protein, partial [Pseudoduganella sp.]
MAAGLLAAYPEFTIDLVCNDRMVDLIEEGFDVGLRLARTLPDSTLVARRLGESPVLLVASPAYLRKHGAPATPGDLAQHNCLVYTQAQRPWEWTFTGPQGEQQAVTVRGQLQANTAIALRRAVLAGAGITAAAAFLVSEDLQRGDLVQVMPGWRLKPRELFALYPQNRHMSPKVRAFIDFAAEVYRQR